MAKLFLRATVVSNCTANYTGIPQTSSPLIKPIDYTVCLRRTNLPKFEWGKDNDLVKLY